MTEFGTLDLAELEAEEKRLSNESGGRRDDIFISIPKPRQGGTTVFPIRLLPPIKGEKLFQYTRLHMIKGHSVHCPKELVQGKKGDPVWDRDTVCPICNYYNSLWRKVDKLEDMGRKQEAEKIKEEARSVKPIERYYYNAIVRSEPGENGTVVKNVGPKILSVGKILHKMIVRAIRGDRESNEPPLGNVTDVKTGYDFQIRMELQGEEKYPNYNRSTFARESSPAGSPEEVKKWAASLHDLKALRKPATVEELEVELARHRNLIDDDDEGFDVDSFDAKYRRPGAASQVQPQQAHSDEESSEPNAGVDDVVIDDEQFLDELESLTAQDA